MGILLGGDIQIPSICNPCSTGYTLYTPCTPSVGIHSIHGDVGHVQDGRVSALEGRGFTLGCCGNCYSIHGYLGYQCYTQGIPVYNPGHRIGMYPGAVGHLSTGNTIPTRIAGIPLYIYRYNPGIQWRYWYCMALRIYRSLECRIS